MSLIFMLYCVWSSERSQIFWKEVGYNLINDHNPAIRKLSKCLYNGLDLVRSRIDNAGKNTTGLIIIEIPKGIICF